MYIFYSQGNLQGFRGQYPNTNYIPITAYQNDMNFDGSFVYGYSAGDGTTAQAQGFIKNLGINEIETQVIQGSYSYTSPEGVPIHVTYIADENGLFDTLPLKLLFIIITFQDSELKEPICHHNHKFLCNS